MTPGETPVGTKVRVRAGCGRKDDLAPWMEQVVAVVEYNSDFDYSVLVRWTLPANPPPGMADHPSIRDNFGWYINRQWLERYPDDQSSHIAW